MATFIPVESVEDDELTDSFVPLEEVPDDSVEQANVPRGTPSVPQSNRPAARQDLTKRLQDSGLFGSATAAMQGAWDKGIRRKADGDWDLPLLAPNRGGVADVIGGFTTTLGQKVGARLDDAGPAIDQKSVQKIFHDFQQANNLSDDEVASVWSDLGNQNRTWGKDENLRILSDGNLLPNPNNSVWLDPAKAESAIDAADVSAEAKAAAKAQLPQLVTNLASEKLGAYEAAANAVNFGRVPASVIGLGTERVVPPSEWAKEKGRTDIGSPQFILDYEADVKPGFAEGLAGKLVLSGNKLATQTLGTVGTLTGSDWAGRKAAEGSEGATAVNRGLPATGIAGSIVEESLPMGAQILTGRGFAAFGEGIATLGTFATAGAQSAGATFADEMANGATEDEARKKAVKAGLSTAIITSMFGTGKLGGVERFAVGAADDVTVGQLVQMARERGVKEIAKSPELRKFAGTVVGSAVGEGAEEGIDQLVGAFLTADPDTPLADAWQQAKDAFTIGAAIGVSTDVAMNMAEHAPQATAAAVGEPTISDGVADENPETAATTPEAEDAATSGDVPALNPDEEAPLPEQPADSPEAVNPPPNVVEGAVEPVENLNPDETGTTAPTIGDPAATPTAPTPVADGGTAVATPEGGVDQAVEDVPIPVAKEAAYSRDALKETFNLDDDQATAADALVQALGLDTSSIRVKKGGTPGQGLAEGDGVTLKQGKTKAKGSFEVLKDGDALIRGLVNPDVSTAVHEISHVARRQLLTRGNEVPGITPQDIEVAEQWAGAKDGVWDVAAEEKFARGFERYLRDGTAPAPELATIFDRIGEWLQTIYKSIKGTSLDVKITPEMRAVLDAMVKRNAAAPSPSENLSTPSENAAPKGETSPAPPAPEPTAKTEPSKEGAAPKTEEKPVLEEDVIGIRKAMTEAYREANGLLRSTLKVGMGDQEAIDQASQRIAEHATWEKKVETPGADPGPEPLVGQALIAHLANNPGRASNKVERALLTHELLLKGKEVIVARNKAKALPDSATVAERLSAEEKVDRALQDVQLVLDTLRMQNSMSGLALQAAKLVVNRSYELVQMLTDRRRWENAGRKPGTKEVDLTAAQKAEVEALHERITAAEKALDDFKEQKAREDAERTHKAEEASRRKAKPKVRRSLGAKIEEAKKRLREQGLLGPETDEGNNFLAQEALPEQTLQDLATFGASWIVDKDAGIDSFKRRLTKTFGPQVAGQAEVIYNRSKEILNAEMDAAVAETTDEKTPKDPQASHKRVIAKWISRLAVSQSDTLEWAKKNGKKVDEMEALIREHLKQPDPEFIEKAVALGATPEQARVLGEVAREETDRVTSIKQWRKANPETPKPKTLADVLDEVDPATGPTGKDVFQLARVHMNAGVEGFENTMDAVLKDLQTKFPDLTLREVHDAYSGYGKTIRPSRDKDLVALREYRSLARLMSQLEDASRSIPPKRTGLQHAKATERVRTLQKQVREMMKKMGIKADSPKSLATALDAVKTRLKNEYEDLDAAVKSLTPLPKKGGSVEYDQEAESLKSKRDAKKAEYDALFPKEGESEDDAIEAAEKSLDRSIEENEELLRKGLSKKPANPKDREPWSKGISERRAKLEDLLKQRKALRDAKAESLARAKKLAQKRIDKIRKRDAEGDYETKSRDPLIPDKELAGLRLEEFKAKREWGRNRVKTLLSQKSMWEKAKYYGKSALGLQRVIKLGGEFGVVARQLFPFTAKAIWQPKAYLDVIRKAGASTFSRAAEESLYEQWTNPESNPDAIWYKDMGIVLHGPHSEHTGFKEDIPDPEYLEKMTELKGKMRVLGYPAEAMLGIERFTRTAINAVRVVEAHNLLQAMRNGTPTMEEAKVIGNAVMNSTGRYAFKNQRLETYITPANAITISARWALSRMAILTGQPLWTSRGGYRGTGKARWEIAKEVYGKPMAGYAALAVLAAMALGRKKEDEKDDGSWINLDPGLSFGQGSLFGRQFDFHGGMRPYLKLAKQFLQQWGHNVNPEAFDAPEADLDNSVKRFIENRRNPIFAWAYDTMFKDTYYGKREKNVVNSLDELVTPVIGKDAYNLYTADDLNAAEATVLFMLLQAGASMPTQPTKR